MNLVSLIRVLDDDNGPEIKKYAVTENVCAGGVYLRTCQPLDLQAKVFIEIFLPVRDYKIAMKIKFSIIRISGRVIRRNGEGMAIEFDKEYSITPIV